MSKYKPGASGNPDGRPLGAKNKISLLRDGLLSRDDAASVVATLLLNAQNGDTVAAGLLLDRLWPRLRPMTAPLELNLPEGADLTTQAQAVISAMARAELSPDLAASIVSALGSLARVKEVDELVRRVAALEQLEHP